MPETRPVPSRPETDASPAPTPRERACARQAETRQSTQEMRSYHEGGPLPARFEYEHPTQPEAETEPEPVVRYLSMTVECGNCENEATHTIRDKNGRVLGLFCAECAKTFK